MNWIKAKKTLEEIAGLDPFEGMHDRGSVPPKSMSPLGRDSIMAWELACGCESFVESCEQCQRRMKIRRVITQRQMLVDAARKLLGA